MSRTSQAWEALQATLSQARETVTRSSRVDIVGGGVDEIDPPEDIDEYAEQAKTNTIARANLRKFVHDVWEPGVRLEGPDKTVQYFEGNREDIDVEPPEETPEGGFLEQATIYAGERYKDFYDFGKECTWQRWARGTVLIEYLKQTPDDPESQISGFSFVRPETVYPQVENNTNILLAPDFEDLPDDISRSDVDFTKRDEVAAYIQFDDESILGLRNNGFDQQDIPLSQNDVLKQTLEPDIGGDVQQGEGVFGTSAIEPVSEDIEEYEQTKRDRFEASQRKAYGVWTAQFKPEVVEGDGFTEIIEWTDDSIGDTEDELNAMGPGDVLTSDANIDLERHSGNVPELEPMLMHYVNEISSALPTPLPLAVDFAGDINRDVTSDQREAYQDTIAEERQTQEKSWTQAFKLVAERIGLPTDGLKMKIQPEKEDNPVKSLDTEEIDRMNTYVQALSAAAGPTVGPTALVDREELLDVLDFPTDSDTQDEMADQMAQMGDEEAAQAWNDIMDVEALESFSEGEWVNTPKGKGLVEDTVSEGTVGGMDASEKPVVVVAMLESEGVEFYRETDLLDAEEPGGPEDPTQELEAMANIVQADANAEALQFGEFDYPESWEESPTPNRAILLKAYAGMGGSFTGCRSEGLRADLCASIKDAVLGTHDWRGGWGNEALAGQSGTEPFADVPVIPTGIERLTPAWLIRWAEWVAAGRPEIPASEALAEWNPALHPRDPETGKFVERSFDLPDDAPNFADMGTGEVLSFLDENGEDIDAVLASDNVSIDGVPTDVNSLDELDEADGDGTVTVDSLPNDAAEFRRGVDTVETGEVIPNDELEVGDTIQVGEGRTAKYMEIEEIEDPETTDDLVLRGVDAGGNSRTARTSMGTIREAEPVELPDIDLNWSDDPDDRQEEVAQIIEATVATGDDAPLDYGNMPLPEENADEFLEDVYPGLARGFATARDAEVAEETIARFGQLGDNGPGASGSLNFSGTRNVAGSSRQPIKLTSTSESTAIHEAAHNIFKSFDLSGQSNSLAHDYEGDIPDIDVNPDADVREDDIDAYTLSPPNDTPLDVDSQSRSLGRSEWEPRVRGEVSTRLSGNRFSSPDDFASWATEDASVGDMVRFEEYPLQTFDEDGPRNYRIAETLSGDEVDRPGAQRGFELEGPNGDTFRVGVGRDGEIKAESIHDTNGFLPEANQKRNGTPDDWGSSSPDLDEVLGNEDPSDSPRERIHRVGREANAAWFKMNLINQNVGEDDAEEATIGGNYSSTNTHETLARLHEYMQADRSSSENQSTAVALVKHHPRLLESYRHAFDIPDEMKQEINSALAGTDADVRL